MKKLKDLPSHSRVWIYQASKEFTNSELELFENKSNSFLNQWTSHGHAMDTTIEILHKRFVIIAVDEQTASASGCGIDKSVRFIQDMEKELKISLLDRMQVAYKTGDKVLACSLQDFEKLYYSKQVDENIIVFNNMVSTKAELVSSWELPLKNSWQMKKLALGAN